MLHIHIGHALKQDKTAAAMISHKHFSLGLGDA